MKRFYLKFRIMLLTFGLGLAGVWFSQNMTLPGNEEKTERVTMIKIAEMPKFIETFRGCGMGYVQGYKTTDGTELTEGNLGCKKPKKNDKRIVRKDERNIIREMKFNGREYFEIYSLEKGNCIDSPSIELGLQLQEFLKQKSK